MSPHHYYYGDGNPVIALIVLLIALVLFFLPSIMAHRRDHFQKKDILFLNFVIAWSGIGWVFLMAYAVLSDGD